MLVKSVYLQHFPLLTYDCYEQVSNLKKSQSYFIETESNHTISQIFPFLKQNLISIIWKQRNKVTVIMVRVLKVQML